MALFYADASALVKLLREEPESEALRAFLEDADLVSSELVLTEVGRAIRRAGAHDPRLPLDALLERAGGLDALRRVNVDLARSRIRVVEQYSAMARTFTLPMNGQTRGAPLTEPAREAILSLPVEGEFCSRRSAEATGPPPLVPTTGRP